MRGHSLVGHLDEIRRWAAKGLSDEEIGRRLGAYWESVARVRRQFAIPNGRDALMERANLKAARPEKAMSNCEAEWTRLLKGRRFDDTAQGSC